MNSGAPLWSYGWNASWTCLYSPDRQGEDNYRWTRALSPSPACEAGRLTGPFSGEIPLASPRNSVLY